MGEESKNVPNWLEFLNKASNEELPNINNKSNRALLILEIENRYFAFSFGYGRYILKPESYVHRFGVKVVLNSVEPNNIKKVDKLTMEEMPVRSQIQASKVRNISEFSIDVYTDYMKGIVGVPKTEEIGNIIAGKDEFKFTSKIDIKELKEKCKIILEKYNSNKYKKNFDWYDHLKAIEDPEKTNELDNELMNKIKARDNDKIYLFPPEMIDWIDTEFSFTKKGTKYSDLRIEDFYKYLNNRKYSFNVSKLKKRKIFIHKDKEVKTWKLYNCIIFEIKEDKKLYILTNGNWFEIEKDFVKEVDQYLEDIPESSIKLPDYNHDSETDYNKAIGKSEDNLISMDKITPTIEDYRGKIELCDLLSTKGHLIHVKHWSRSSTLSHLFAQGRVAATSLINNSKYGEKIKEKVENIDDSFSGMFTHTNPDNFFVVYAIIYKKDKPIHERLPFFSKLNMRQNVQQLRERQFKVEKMKIKNIKN